MQQIDLLKDTEVDRNSSVKIRSKATQNALDKGDKQKVKLIMDSADDLADPIQLAGLSGNLISQKKPDFDPKNYRIIKAA